MKPGRKPLPTQLRIVTGNAGKRKLNIDEPKPSQEIPEPARHLSVREKKHFVEICNFLAEMKILATSDKYTIELAAHYWEDYLILKKHVKKDRFQDAFDKEGNKTVKSHPAVGQRNASVKMLNSLLGELGLTPTARTRLVSSDSEGGGGDDLLD